MSTSGGGLLNAVLYVLVLWAGITAGVDALRRPPRPTPVAAGLWLLVAVPSVLQFVVSGLEPALRRDPDEIRHHGQVWRLLTSVVVQDGGAFGTVWNLVVLALVLLVAGDLWGPVRTPVLFVAGQLVFDVVAVFASTDKGAGNSAATFSLAATVTVLAGWSSRTAVGWSRAAAEGWGRAGLVLVVGAVCLAIEDAHGFAMLGGLVLGAVAVAAWPPPRVSSW